jgi:hypothetical protein
MRFHTALLGACLLSASAAAAAESVAFSSPRPGESLRAGSQFEIRWTGVRPEAEEMELLLSLGGGRRIALRLTAELAGNARSFVWRVPNLATTRASLVLRVGSAGGEAIAGSSAAFEIVADPGLARERLAERGGELWLASETAASDELPPAGMSSEDDGWTTGSGWRERPLSPPSPTLLPLLSPSRLFQLFPANSARMASASPTAPLPPPAPTLRI